MPEARARRRASLPASNRFFLRFFTQLSRKVSFLTPSVDASTKCCGREIELRRSLVAESPSDLQASHNSYEHLIT